MTAHRLVAALAAGLLAGCPTPMLHPLRASNGFHAAAAVSIVAANGRHGWCDLGCQEVAGPVVGANVAIAAGYAHVFGDLVGVQLGLYALAMANAQTGGPEGAVAGYSFFTVQNRTDSVGIGPEFSATGASITIGAEHRWPNPVIAYIPAVGVFARWFVPFSRATHDWLAERTPTFEIGARGRFGPFIAQYTYYSSMEHRLELPYIVEGSMWADGFHLFSFGVMFDDEFVEHRRARRSARGR